MNGEFGVECHIIFNYWNIVKKQRELEDMVWGISQIVSVNSFLKSCYNVYSKESQ